LSISVIVPTLNDSSQLKGLLSSLSGQDAEVICGDGGSTDGTIKTALAMGAKCVVKVGGDGIECSNLAAGVSQREILLFTASDVRMESSAISRIKKRFEDPSLLGLTGWPVLYDGSVLCRLEYAGYYLLARLLASVRFVSCGNFLAVRASAFWRLGGFRESYNNDGQFGRALRKLGKTRFDHSLRYYVSARRYKRLGFLEFHRQRLYALENFLP
jgi:glycosyltransferase involved in cell wall biosynthesis